MAITNKSVLKDTRCVICMHAETTQDGDFYWCAGELCQARRRLLSWLRSHNYRELKFWIYVIGEGQYCCQVAAMMGSEDMIYQALAYIENLEMEEE